MDFKVLSNMPKNKRKQNEKEYPNWSELDNGGRLYWKEISASDKSGKIARYEKSVDNDENTVSFNQAILDKNGNIIEIHEKFPIDKGHILIILLLLIINSFITYNIV